MDGPRAGELQANTVNLATAYGLALQGLGMAALEANLMPSLVIRDAMWKRKVKWFGVAAGVAIAASGAMFIRPFLDSQAVAADPPPQSVRDAISAAQRLKSAASDVTSSTIENSAAAGVLALLESRDVFGHLVNDVGLMMKHAQEREKKEEPVFSVKTLRTRHRQGGMTDPNQQFGAEPDADTRDRIQVTMELTTTHADPQRLAFNTLDEWLRRNAKRPGVPYEIVAANNPSRLVSTVETQAPTAAAGGSPPSGDGVAGGSAGSGGPTPMGGGRPGRFGAPPGGGMAGEGPVQSGPGGGPTGGPSDDPADSAAAGAVRRMAPLPGAPQDPPGTRLSTFEVKFDLVLLPKGGQGGGM
jgi:type IV pilus assembly protein PilM